MRNGEAAGNRSGSPPSKGKWEIAVPDEITALLDAGSPTAIGISGGKDSQAVALRVYEYLDEMGYKQARLLIHSDLGRIEWPQSIQVCHTLAETLQTELMVVRREAGDLIHRWETRWGNNVKRYYDLACVKLIMPWSSAQMRFCSSELKASVISRALLKKFPGKPIINITGVRGAESANRARQPVCEPQPRLTRKGVIGWDWRPIHRWSTEDVFSYIASKGVSLHEAYTEKYGSSRVSCAYCCLQSLPDMQAAVRCRDNWEAYRLVVDLETRSAFSFQQGRWLADLAPHLLTFEQQEAAADAKKRAQHRMQAEALIPKYLLFTKGWPQALPTREEAQLLANVRKEVFASMGMPVTFVSPDDIIARYGDLLSRSPGIQKQEELTLFDCELTAAA